MLLVGRLMEETANFESNAIMKAYKVKESLCRRINCNRKTSSTAVCQDAATMIWFLITVRPLTIWLISERNIVSFVCVSFFFLGCDQHSTWVGRWKLLPGQVLWQGDANGDWQQAGETGEPHPIHCPILWKVCYYLLLIHSFPNDDQSRENLLKCNLTPWWFLSFCH